MYMLTLVEVQAFRATGQPDLDRAALEMIAYLDKLHKPTACFVTPSTTPFSSGRGNGWVAAGMSETLRSPAGEPSQSRAHHGRLQRK